jgi:hypothetical protein
MDGRAASGHPLDDRTGKSPRHREAGCGLAKMTWSGNNRLISVNSLSRIDRGLATRGG